MKAKVHRRTVDLSAYPQAFTTISRKEAKHG
jgi:hypothetical protein